MSSPGIGARPQTVMAVESVLMEIAAVRSIIHHPLRVFPVTMKRKESAARTTTMMMLLRLARAVKKAFAAQEATTRRTTHIAHELTLTTMNYLQLFHVIISVGCLIWP